ncbi:hypothetical protein BD779DRAFT_1562485 [Infundibulicybe gibba]|nr:hypothetical protein BD779DRAFT_1562485 [Infundibulicybe gibba]
MFFADIYYASSKNDRISLKLLVCFLFLATTAQTSFATYCAWQTLVVSWSTIVPDPYLGYNLLYPFDSFDKATVVLPVINGISKPSEVRPPSSV